MFVGTEGLPGVVPPVAPLQHEAGGPWLTQEEPDPPTGEGSAEDTHTQPAGQAGIAPKPTANADFLMGRSHFPRPDCKGAFCQPVLSVLQLVTDKCWAGRVGDLTRSRRSDTVLGFGVI